MQLGRKVVGRVLAITEFGEIGEDPYTVVLTSHRQYAYNPAAFDWKDLTPSQVDYTITAVTTGTKTFKIAGDHTADFPVGRLIPVIGGANQEVYTVVSATLNAGNTDIVVAETIPSAVVAGVITIAEDFETATDGQVEYASLTDENGHRLLITNGVDTPRTWDGNLASMFADWAPNFTDFVTCRTLAVFNEHLFLGYIETSTEEPQLVAWSAAGDFDEFEEGDSGVQLLYALTTGIRQMELLGDRLAIYSTDAIMNGTFVGLPAVFAFEVVIPEGTRLVSSKALASINVGHFFLSEENMYLYDGTRGLRVLGEAIHRDYKIVKDHAFLYETVMLNDYSKRTLYIAIPDAAGESIIYTLYYDIFDLGNAIWAKEKYNDDVRAWGFFTNRDEAVTWEDLSWEVDSTVWGSEIGDWGMESEQLNFPIRCYGTTEGLVILVTEGYLLDRTATADQLYDTKDFTIPEVDQSHTGRWGEIEFEASGVDVDVLYSVNQGGTFVSLGTVTLDGTSQTYRVPVDVVGRTFRVRFVSDSEFRLSWVRCWTRPGGPA